MFSLEMFLGFPMDAAFGEALERLDPQVAALFIRDDDHYLKQVVDEDVSYLGKFVGSVCDSATLDLMEKNIYSLLKKLVPDYPYEAVPLILFPAEGDHNRP